jgi:hypothetical protein
VLATDTCHRSEWGTEIPTHIARDFIYTAVRHPAVAAFVTEYVFDAIRDGDELCDIAEALRVAIDEILNAAASEDWEQVGCDLIAWARNFLEPAPSDDTVPMGESLWPRPSSPPAKSTRRRKPPVRVDQDAILAWMRERRLSATPQEIAEHFNVSAHGARCKADGLVAQGKLTVTPGIRGHGSTLRRYSIPRLPGPTKAVGVAGT